MWARSGKRIHSGTACLPSIGGSFCVEQLTDRPRCTWEIAGEIYQDLSKDQEVALSGAEEGAQTPLLV